MEGKKKVSLFKQKLQQSQGQDKQRKQEQTETKGFPAVIKIDTSRVQEKSEGNRGNKQGFLTQMKQEQYINQSEYDTINQNNRKYLDGLSEEEIQRMRKEIMEQLSPNLISKLNLRTDEMKQPQVKQQNKPAHNLGKPLEQSIPSQSPPQPQMETQPSPPPYPYKLRTEDIDLLDNITFNLHTQLLSRDPRSEQNPKLIQIHKMLSSDNNQTVLVGIKLFRSVLSMVQSTPWKYDIASMNRHYFHRKIILAYVHKRFIKEVWRQKLWNSKFVTLRVESLEGVGEFVKAGGEVGENILVDLLCCEGEEGIGQYIKEINCTNIVYSSETIDKLKGMNIEIITGPETTLFFSNLDSINLPSILPSSPNPITILSICQKLLSEALHLQRSREVECLNQLDIFSHPSYLPFVFLTVQYLKFKQIYSKQPLIRLILSAITVITKDNWDSLTQFLQNSAQTPSYQILYIYKQTNPLQYVQYLKHLSTKQIPEHSSLQKVLLLLNIEGYLETQWQQNEIQLINESLLSIHNLDQTIEYSMLFHDLAMLFTNQKQSYFQLNQDKLDSVLSSVVQRMRPEYLQLVMGIQTIKKLVEYYIYNSYGNIVFSKVILLLGSTIMKQDVQIYIVGEIYYRYPGILMEAGKGDLYGGKEFYLFSRRSSKVQGDLEKVREMVEANESNKFYAMLGESKDIGEEESLNSTKPI